jgi:hypothetical protein
MLTDPPELLAEQSSFVNGLVGLAGLAEVVRALAAADGARATTPATEADDWVHLLLGVASLGTAVGQLAPAAATDQSEADQSAAPPAPGRPPSRWLR